MIFLFAPLLFLIFGISSLHASLLGILTFWLPYFLLTSVVERVTLDKRMKRFWSNIYETSVAPFLAWSVLVETFTKKNIPFNVTPKGVTLSKARINIPFIIPHFIFLGLSIVALVMGILNFIEGYHDGIIINLFWLIYNLVILMPTILLARERPKFRQTERFDRNYPVRIKAESMKETITAKTINISESGCSLYIADLQTVPEEIQIDIEGKYSIHCIDGLLVYYDTYKDGYQLGIKFKDLDSMTFQHWVKELYGEVPNESLFQYKAKTGMLNIFKKFYKELQLPYQKKVRTSPRLEMNIDCLVFGLSNETLVSMEQTGAAIEEYVSNTNNFEDSFEKNNAILSDVGINGCKLEMKNTNFTIGDVVGLQLSNMGWLIKGTIVRSRPIKEKIELGIKWTDHEQGIKILNYINEKDLS
ncbi:hypothetical protein JOC85_003119 [Bacillus mesophilus]|uniref:PilZ domain-containing protein n=1 Tax=Bacillus mesophilus TaxID=1808955 RepID=A0A6M0Q9W8_9BACI|nr:PilZ domain-containing protein [Bacillus mesophilus]MBM7662312.1 hypothetical protein [Bacillus mesophilus]NEY73057.1 hypothetical protein [Bacillus mesophilus]